MGAACCALRFAYTAVSPAATQCVVLCGKEWNVLRSISRVSWLSLVSVDVLIPFAMLCEIGVAFGLAD